jgi:aspartyl protease family protein
MFAKTFAATVIVGVSVGLLMPTAPTTPPAAVARPEPSAAATQQPNPQPNNVAVIERSDDGHFYVNADVNGQLVHFLVDTGATAVVLTMADAKHVGLPFAPERFTVVGRGASGDTRGELITIGRVAIGRKEAFDVKGVVLDEGLDISLLGQSFLSRVGTVVIDGDTMVLR